MNITPKKLWFISYLFWAAAIVTVLVCALLSFQEEVVEDGEEDRPVFVEPVQNSFLQKKGLHEALQEPLFRLSKVDRPLRLPDLRTHVLFFGSGGRPDKSLSDSVVQYGFRNVQGVYSTPASEKVSLRFDPKTHKWAISQTPTSLQIRFVVHTGGAEVIVELEGDDGQLITTPQELHRFTLNQTPLPPSMNAFHEWTIGQWRAEPSILEKQGALWYGRDLVINTFGGEEYVFEAGRERVQFGTGDDAYVLWMGEGDCFVFDEFDRWRRVTPGPESIGKPLLRVKTIDQRSITFDLWSEEGSSRVNAVLMRRNDPSSAQIPSMRLVGALSKKRWIAEIQGKRIVLAPDDWIVLTSNGHTRIDSPEQLDAYIEGRLSGSLLAFSGIEKIQGESCLVGSFFNNSRSQQDSIVVSLYKSWGRKDTGSVRMNDNDDNDDDEYLFDDEFDDDDYDDDDYDDDYDD